MHASNGTLVTVRFATLTLFSSQTLPQAGSQEQQTLLQIITVPPAAPRRGRCLITRVPSFTSPCLCLYHVLLPRELSWNRTASAVMSAWRPSWFRAWPSTLPPPPAPPALLRSTPSTPLPSSASSPPDTRERTHAGCRKDNNEHGKQRTERIADHSPYGSRVSGIAFMPEYSRVRKKGGGGKRPRGMVDR